MNSDQIRYSIGDIGPYINGHRWVCWNKWRNDKIIETSYSYLKIQNSKDIYKFFDIPKI